MYKKIILTILIASSTTSKTNDLCKVIYHYDEEKSSTFYTIVYKGSDCSRSLHVHSSFSSEYDFGALTPQDNLSSYYTHFYNEKTGEFYPNKSAFINAENLYKAQNEKK